MMTRMMAMICHRSIALAQLQRDGEAEPPKATTST